MFVKTDLGTPQGGIISPTLANLTLNGLEKAINDSLLPLTTSKEKRIVIKLKDGSKTRIASGLAYVRYADDFVVLARSKYIINELVIPAVNNFLRERGLMLSPEKTKVFRLSDNSAELNFLGYTFKYQPKWRINKGIFFEHHAGSRGIALYPNKNKVLAIIKKIKSIFDSSQNSDAYNLIVKLNPLIRGWSNYFNMGNSSRYRSTVRNAIYQLI
jgi:RNA-directed DNA polymerase